jgi:hypothetical protein
MVETATQSGDVGCQHPQLHFGSGDYYVFCSVCLARWGRLSDDGRPEYRTLDDGTKIGCAPEEANKGYVSDGTTRKRT